MPTYRAKPRAPRINWAHPAAKGLVGAWLFTEGAGDRTADAVARGSFGTLTSSPTWGTGEHGPVINCTGGSYVALNNWGNLAAGDFTLRIVHTPSAWTGGFTALFDKNGGGTRELTVFCNTSGNLSFYGIGGGTGSISIPTGMTTGSRWDLVLTRQGSTVTAYINGQPKGTFTAAGTTAGAGSVALGANTSGGGTSPSTSYEQVQAWNRALSPETIQALYGDWRALFAPPSGADRVLALTLAAGAHIWPEGAYGPTHRYGMLGRYEAQPGRLSPGAYYVAPSSGAVTLSGTLAGAGGTSGTLTISRRPAGIVAGAGSVTGAVQVSRRCSGSLSGGGTVSGAARVSRRLSGTAAGGGSLTTTGPTLQRRFSGTTAGVGAVTGSLAVSRRLAGTLSGTGATSAALTVRRLLSGLLAGHGGLSGSLAGVPLYLSGILGGSGQVSGNPTVIRRPGGTLAGAGATTGMPTVRRGLTGTLAGAGSVSGAARVSRLLTGLLAGHSALTGTLTLTLPPPQARYGGSVRFHAEYGGSVAIHVEYGGRVRIIGDE